MIDSIKTQLKGAEGKRRFDLLNDLAWEYRFATPDSTIYWGNQAYELGKALNLSRQLAEPLNFIGVAYNYKGERLKAFEYYDQALQVGISQRDSSQVAHANNNIGRLFYEQGLLSRSYDYFIRAQAIFASINDSSGLAYSLQSLANLYKTQRDYDKAEVTFLKAYRLRLILGSPREIMAALLYLGRLYQESNQFDKGVRYLEMADSTGHVIRDEINIAEVKTYLAEGYLAQGLLKKAEVTSRQGLDVIERKKNTRMMPQAYEIMGRINMQRGDLKGAKTYFRMSLDIASRTKDLNAKMEAYYYLWKLSEEEKNLGEAQRNLNQYLILKDSIKDLDLARQVERFQFEIEIQRKEQENELLKVNDSRNAAIIQQQKLQNIVLIVIVGFVSILGFLQWMNSKKRREFNEKLINQNEEIQQQREEIIRQNEKLSKRNQQLSDLNHEKDTLMSIVAHDLKSPLNRIKGIIRLIEMEGGITENQKEYLNMTKIATQSGLDLITDLLDVHMIEENVEPNYSTFDISKFLLDKTDAFTPGAAAKNIHLHITRVENEDIHTDHDYLDRIIDNLLSNAIKFSPKNSVIDISGDRTDHEFWISVKDQGPGFTEEDKGQLFKKFKKLSARPTAGETSNGLGLAIVKTLVDRLRGNIELVSSPGKGSQFTVRFPIDGKIA
ncbi:MAG: tetratricopeptide repeat-containing sensor histidine kinase [Bacteroidota bacterium]